MVHGVILGLAGLLVAIVIELYFTRGGYGSPGPGRMTELVTLRGYHIWVSDVVRFAYWTGFITFLIGLTLAAWLAFARRGSAD